MKWLSEEIKVSCIGLTSHRHYSRNWEATYQEYVEQEWNFDWLIFTGAWVEFIPEDEIEFSSELRELIHKSQDEVFSCIYSCWSSHFASSELLWVHKRLDYKKKIFWVFSHEVTQPENPLCNNLPPNFIAPHSRFWDISVSEISKSSQTEVLVKCYTNNSFLLATNQKWRNIFIQWHPEYHLEDLQWEYERDAWFNSETQVPENYFIWNTWGPIMQDWSIHFRVFMKNWIDLVKKRKESVN